MRHPRASTGDRLRITLATLAALALAAGFQPPALGSPAVGKGGARGGDSRSALHGLLVFSRQVCASKTDPCWEIVVSDARENHARVVAGPYPSGVWDDHFLPNWAPDGHSVIFMADLGTGPSVWRVRTDGTHLHAAFTAPEGTFLDDGPAFTPDGRHIVFTRCCAPEVPTGYGLWSITPDGHHLRPVTSEAVPPGIDGPSDNLPQVSPRGSEVTYSRNVVDPAMGEPLGSRISIAPLPAGDFTDITDPTELDPGIPNWTPDGQEIAFQNVAADDSVDIWRVGRDGTGLTRLTTDGVSLNPSYTPDGRLLLTRIDQDGGRDIFVAQPDGSDPQLVKATAGIERFPHLIVPQDDQGDGDNSSPSVS
jgi:Tol biopolymer transport system component